MDSPIVYTGTAALGLIIDYDAQKYGAIAADTLGVPFKDDTLALEFYYQKAMGHAIKLEKFFTKPKKGEGDCPKTSHHDFGTFEAYWAVAGSPKCAELLTGIREVTDPINFLERVGDKIYETEQWLAKKILKLDYPEEEEKKTAIRNVLNGSDRLDFVATVIVAVRYKATSEPENKIYAVESRRPGHSVSFYSEHGQYIFRGSDKDAMGLYFDGYLEGSGGSFSVERNKEIIEEGYSLVSKFMEKAYKLQKPKKIALCNDKFAGYLIPPPGLGDVEKISKPKRYWWSSLNWPLERWRQWYESKGEQEEKEESEGSNGSESDEEGSEYAPAADYDCIINY